MGQVFNLSFIGWQVENLPQVRKTTARGYSRLRTQKRIQEVVDHSAASLLIEKLPFPVGPEKYRFDKVPKRPDNLYWMMTCLSGELFFVGAVIFFLLAWQTNVPRWTLILPIAQCAYNIKNDLLWVGSATNSRQCGNE